MTKTSIQIRSASAALGAEVLGADLRQDDGDTFKLVHKAFLDFDGLVFMRDQVLTPQEHIKFSGHFGPLLDRGIDVSKSMLLEGFTEILILSNRRVNGAPVGLENAGHYWHSDMIFTECPPMGSLLYAVEVPPEGGDTLFCNMYRAYETLPAQLRSKVDRLQASHTFAGGADGYEKGGKRADITEEQKARQRRLVNHPIVRTHPETGRKALYVNRAFTKSIIGMDEGEGKALLELLFVHSTKDEFIYRHKWRRNDLLVWDNRCLMHCATAYDPKYTRHMLRTTVAGDRPY